MTAAPALATETPARVLGLYGAAEPGVPPAGAAEPGAPPAGAPPAGAPPAGALPVGAGPPGATVVTVVGTTAPLVV